MTKSLACFAIIFAFAFISVQAQSNFPELVLEETDGGYIIENWEDTTIYDGENNQGEGQHPIPLPIYQEEYEQQEEYETIYDGGANQGEGQHPDPIPIYEEQEEQPEEQQEEYETIYDDGGANQGEGQHPTPVPIYQEEEQGQGGGLVLEETEGGSIIVNWEETETIDKIPEEEESTPPVVVVPEAEEEAILIPPVKPLKCRWVSIKNKGKKEKSPRRLRRY